MKLLDISLNNFRNFEDYHVALGRKATVLIGRNGTGKTNLLEGIVKALSFIFSKQRDRDQYEFIRSSGQSVQRFSATDPRFVNGDYGYPLRLQANAFLNEENQPSLNWAFEQDGEKSGLKDSLFRSAYQIFWEHYNHLSEKPVLAYFSDGFPHQDIRISAKMNEKLESGFPLPANTGYYQWDDKRSSAELWKTYFMQEWMNNSTMPDKEKQRFVDAVNEKFREFSTPIDNNDDNSDWSVDYLFVQFRSSSMRLMVHFANGDEKPFETLPAGYYRMFSLLLDLTCRSYLLNNNTNPDGIVLIDEIDLHLHPSLAANILPRLQRSFPRIQFITSTHSPMVISNFDQESSRKGDYALINLLKNDEGYFNKTIDNIYGLDYNSSLVNIMDTSQNEKYNDELANAYLYWRENDEDRASQIAALLRDKYGNESEIIRKLDL